jgi:ubiquinone/menaquinone biosynthesis C-methylase UbiE
LEANKKKPGPLAWIGNLEPSLGPVANVAEQAGELALESAAFAFSVARSLFYGVEYDALGALTRGQYALKFDASLTDKIRESSLKLFRQDSQNIREGVYPPSVLFPESPVKHAARIPRLFADALSINRRRAKGRTNEFSSRVNKEDLEEVPLYFRRNFHFQTDGYLTKHSAELWDHQVEMLFRGTADAMRRLMLPSMGAWAINRTGRTDGQGLRILEIGASTGRATRFTKLALPLAQVTVSDLSDAYLKVAREKLSHFDRVDFARTDGTSLPFRDEQFDAVYSVFLFHELPLKARQAVLKESARVLKPGGYFGFVDSLQKGDTLEFNSMLDAFPVSFHEPFYRNYSETPMEPLLREAGLNDVRSGTGFVSKFAYAIK